MSLYGTFVYGSALYGIGPMPISPDWEVYDFCYPVETRMLTIFSYVEVTPSRPFGSPYVEFDINYDLCLFSNDEVDSGFRIDIAIGNKFSIQFNVKPVNLPDNFSDTSKSRFFVAAYNHFGKMLGLLISKSGIALAQEGDGPYVIIPGSASLISEGVDYYTFRVTVNEESGKTHIYVTKTDLIPVTGLQLRYTLDALDSPLGAVDHVIYEVYGTAASPTDVHFDCLKFSNTEKYTNQRPIAITGPDQVAVKDSYASFDGRESYDPDSDVELNYWWSCIDAPINSSSRITGISYTEADISGFTNKLVGIPGTFYGVSVTDIITILDTTTTVLYIPPDSSYLITYEASIPAGYSDASWIVISQKIWEGAYDSPTNFKIVNSIVVDEPLSPSTNDSYLVQSGGAWAVYADQIATWNGISWVFTPPNAGDIIYIIGSRYCAFYSDSFPTGTWLLNYSPNPWEIPHWSGRATPISSMRVDELGLYNIQLIVNDGELNSLPSEALLNTQVTPVPHGVIKDVSWIWNLISDFWDLETGKEKIETIWRGISQVAAGFLFELWQHDYAKALTDVQRVFQKRWLNYPTVYKEPNYEVAPAEIISTVSLSGFATNPGSNQYSYTTDTNLTGVTANCAFVLDGEVYRIISVNVDPLGPVWPTIITLRDPLPIGTHSKYWQIRPTLKSQSSDFSAMLISPFDTAIFEIEIGSSSIDVETHVYGARQNFLAFDETPVSTYITDGYAVNLKEIVSRNYLYIPDEIVAVPRLQDVINTELVSGGSVYFANKDYRIATVTNSLGNEVNSVQLMKSFYEEKGRGIDGTTSFNNYFDSASGDFETVLVDVTDFSNYLVEINSVKYRLKGVVSSTRLELVDDALEIGLSKAIWSIYEVKTPPENLWAELTLIDNKETIEANFGRLVNLTAEQIADRSDGLDYLSAVKGLWYTYWFGPKPFNMRVGVQILLGLPFAEQKGTITDIRIPFDETRSRILIQDYDKPTIIRSYFFNTTLGIEENPETGLDYAVGDSVEQFAPLSKGAEVTDWIRDPEWFSVYNSTRDFPEVWKYHTFGVLIDAAAFSLTNLGFVQSYVQRSKPVRTNPWFVIRLAPEEDEINIQSRSVSGPVIPPANRSYPEDWDSYPIPSGWAAPAPNEVQRHSNPVLPQFNPITGLWTVPSDRPLAVEIFGGLHVFDGLGRIPDGWSGSWPSGAVGAHAATRAEGAARYDDTDESGHCIHRYDSPGVTGLLTDGDMESPTDPGPGQPWELIGAPAVAAKSLVTVRSGARSLEISSALPDEGVFQYAPAIYTEGFQGAVICWVFVVDGQAVIELINQNGDSVALQRFSVVPGIWQKCVLHSWEINGTTLPMYVKIATGPAGGHFFVDDAEMYWQQVPWNQWLYDRKYMGRTGGYTQGGCPDERFYFSFYTLMP